MGDLFDIFDHAYDVVHAVAQLLFPSFDTQGFQPRIRILASTDHRALAVAIKLELTVLLEVRGTLAHLVTAVHSTSGAWARLCDVDRTHRGAPLPCATRKSCGVCWARRQPCRGRPVVLGVASYPLPPIDPDPPV